MLLGKPAPWWTDKNGIYTVTEILQQPETWKKTIAQLDEEGPAVQAFIESALADGRPEIIFAGAGTSEFVGNAIFPYVQKHNDAEVRSVATTDIVADPALYIDPDKQVLMVNFGRSGDSPESVGAVELANTVSPNVSHLMITCNPDGALGRYGNEQEGAYAIHLTPETHDKSFAMTSSFSNMMLAALLAFGKEPLRTQALEAADCTAAFIENNWEKIQAMVDEFDFSRIVYLGSNVLKGIAQESALKMCELNAGDVDTVFDTPTGFRHGPKSVINDKTLTVIFFSDDPYTRQYEMDILKEIHSQKKGDRILSVTGQYDEEVEKLSDWYLTFDNPAAFETPVLGMEYIVAAQLIALFKSLKSGCTPDNPCPTGEVNRVVKGVTIYPL